MASTYSTNLAIELLGGGEQSGTWGTTTNTNLGTLIEQAISGYVTYSATGSGATDVLTIPNGASGTARNMYIRITGSGGGTIEVPANNKLYFVWNNTTSGSITFKVTGQTGVVIPNNKKMLLVIGTDGTTVDARSAVDTLSSLYLNGTAAINTQILTAGGTTTGSISFGATNTSGGFILGAESSTGNSLITGATAYATALKSSSQPLFVSINNGTSACLVVNTSGEIFAGTGDTAASPAAGVLRGANGYGSNVSANSLTIQSGIGTGTGTGGSIIFKTASAGASGSTLNTASNRLEIDKDGNVGVGVTPVSNNGILQVAGHASVQALLEKATIVNPGSIPGLLNYDVLTQAVLYYPNNASNNWIINVRGSSGVPLNSVMQPNQSITIALLVKQGPTIGYYQTFIQVDGGSYLTPKWQGGTAPSTGNQIGRAHV